MELNVELCRFLEGCGDTSYLGNLATYVEVDECEAVLKIHFLEGLQGCKQFGAVETKFAGIATALLPFAATAGSQLDTNA